jgi:hypothetical protein
MDTWVWIVLAVVALAVVAAVAYAVSTSRRRQRDELREGFGPEYDRTVAESPSRREAEAELRERQKRHDELELRPLSREARSGYRRDWDATQARFVDDPDGAIGDADALIQQVMRERGYQVDDADRSVDDLSVEHGEVMHEFRAAQVIARRSADGEASTEEQRQAIVHYRALFEALVEAGEPARAER